MNEEKRTHIKFTLSNFTEKEKSQYSKLLKLVKEKDYKALENYIKNNLISNRVGELINYRVGVKLLEEEN
jgi:hypothetical protein